MNTIGIIGGMSWESTAIYYRLLNEGIRDHLGGLHSAKIRMESFDFSEIEQLQRAGKWTEAGSQLAEAGIRLESVGADVLLIATNTMHKVADVVESAVSIPLLHIADSTGERIKKAGIRRVALLGTKFTMEQDFYRGRLKEHYGLEVLIPEPEARDTVHRVIFKELCQGHIREESRQAYLNIIHRMLSKGAEGVIFGCTEIGLLLSEEKVPVPVFDTTRIHAEAAVHWALGSKD